VSVDKPSVENTEQVNLPFTDLGRFEMRAGHHHIRHDNGYESGTEVIYQLQPGIMLRVLDLFLHTEGAGETSAPEKKFIFSFKLRGNNMLTVEGGMDMDLDMSEGSLWVSYSEHPFRMVESSPANQKYLLVMLLCDPDVLLQPPFDQVTDNLPECIQRVLAGEEYIAEKFTMNMDLIQALGVLLNSETVDSYNRPFIQAKTVELMCLALRNVSQQESLREKAHISEKEQKAVEKACQLLQKNWQKPPTQDELIKIVGIGRSQLTKCFKLIYGYSITDYVLNIRMQHAQQLLTEGKLNVTQVALEVGYEHSNNFASAFKRRFGITPKAFQTASLGHKTFPSSSV
jgi:AraC-like DNA-binding protein